MSQQQQSNLNISQVQNQSARLNIERQRVSFFQRLRNNTMIKLSRKNILKGFFLILIIATTFWMAQDFLHQTLIHQRTPFQFGKIRQDTKQIASPEDTTLKSFYYFQKMVELAKQNVKTRQTFEYNLFSGQQVEKIEFWEMYGLFKVVKAIQLANNYTKNDKKDDTKDQQSQELKYQSIDNLTVVVNLTSYFNLPADQGMCASCYSFPIAATIEYQITKKTGKKVKLSEQQLIDCSNPDPQANGCQYGNMTRGFQYAKNFGLVEQKMYPYRSQIGTSFACNTEILGRESQSKYRIKKYRSLPSGDCQAIQYELVNGNAVASMINVGRMGNIKDYSKPFKDCLPTSPNHAVTIVGQTENQDWIVRNSWGQSWGDKGYFIIKRGNTCGVCNHAIVPQIQ